MSLKESCMRVVEKFKNCGSKVACSLVGGKTRLGLHGLQSRKPQLRRSRKIGNVKFSQHRKQ